MDEHDAVRTESPDLRLVAMGAAAWAVTFAGLTASRPILMAMAVAALVVALLATGLRRWAVVAVAIVALCLTVTTGLRTHSVRASPTAALANDRAAVTLTAQLASDVRLTAARGVRPDRATVVVHVRTLEARGRSLRGGPDLQLSASGDLAAQLARWPAGSAVRVQGRLGPAQPDDPTAGQVTVRAPPELVSGPGPAARFVNHLRAELVHATRWSPTDQAALLPSLVVGDTSRLSPEVVARFKDTGLTHLTAVSGSNLVLLLGFFSVVATRLGARGRVLRVVQVFAVVGFVVLCRAEPSVVRAAAMGVVALAALGNGGIGRARDPVRGFRYLSAAVLMLMVVDPWLSRSWGFALSAGATAGLVACARRYQQAMRWAPAWLAEAIAVPMAAQLATQPLVTALSGTVSLSGLVANAFSGPFVGPATVLGMVAAFSSLLPGLVGDVAGAVFGWLGGWCVEPLLLIARLGSGLPGGTLTWPANAVGLVVIGGLSLAAAVALPLVLRSRLVVVALAVLMVTSLVRAPVSPGWPGQWQVAFCSVGQGDAAVLRAGAHQAVLVDTGPNPAPLVTCLRQLGVQAIPVIVLTHFHADHTTGLATVLDTYPVSRIIVSRQAPGLPTARQVSAVAASHGVPVESAVAGERWRVGNVHWHTIRTGPPPGARDLSALPEGMGDQLNPENSSENDASVMGVAEVEGLRVMLAGDSEPEAQRAALRASALHFPDDPEAAVADFRADVMAMPHHGSSRQEKRFWQATGARLAVSSSGVDNDYGHPSAKAVDLAHSLGMTVAQTNQLGSIAVRREGNGDRPRLHLLNNKAPQQ